MMSTSSEPDYSDDFPPLGVSVTRFAKYFEMLKEKGFPQEPTNLEIEFRRLEDYSMRQGIDEEFAEANKMINRPKNRYANVLPPGKTRVKLLCSESHEEIASDYINANYISGFKGPRTYIASQGPLRQTMNDFWRMIWEEDCDMIVMLTNVRENGRLKCHAYWPEDTETTDTFMISLLHAELSNTMIRRTFLVENLENGEEREISHFQYIEWPDHGLPASTKTFREMLPLVNQLHQKDSPILVHCSAGIGRTGTFCTVHSILEDVKLHGNSTIINIPETVLKLRKERTGMVQTREQYEFCYIAILEELDNMTLTEAEESM